MTMSNDYNPAPAGGSPQRSEEDLRKARRAQWILYSVMFGLLILNAILFYLFGGRREKKPAPPQPPPAAAAKASPSAPGPGAPQAP